MDTFLTKSLTQWLGYVDAKAMRHLLSGIRSSEGNEESIKEAVDLFSEMPAEVEVERKVVTVDEDGEPTEAPIRRIIITGSLAENDPLAPGP
jgi:hypothetical protein